MASNHGEKIVLVAGTFDMLHPGHVHLITEARKLGKVVVVVGTDAIVEKLKGRKPVIPQAQRAFMIGQLRGVDRVVIGHETMDFTRVVADIGPDMILLGPDQGPSEARWREQLAARGLQVEVRRLPTRVNEFPVCSTSGIIEKIKRERC